MSFDQKQGNNFFCVPRLPNDGKGFIIWKEHVELSIWAWGLYSHLDGTMTRPSDLPTKPEGSTLTAEEVSLIEKHTRDLNQYLQEQAMVFQQIASTIPDSLYLKIKGKPTVKNSGTYLRLTLRGDLEWLLSNYEINYRISNALIVEIYIPILTWYVLCSRNLPALDLLSVRRTFQQLFWDHYQKLTCWTSNTMYVGVALDTWK